jgi:hypothetical protein
LFRLLCLFVINLMFINILPWKYFNL